MEVSTIPNVDEILNLGDSKVAEIETYLKKIELDYDVKILIAVCNI